LIFGLKIERGVVYITGKSYARPCRPDDWVNLSQIKCDDNPPITSASFLEMAEQTHVSSVLYAQVIE
jgi:hypothetical protein